MDKKRKTGGWKALRERERQTDRQTDKQRQRHTETETEREPLVTETERKDRYEAPTSTPTPTPSPPAHLPALPAAYLHSCRRRRARVESGSGWWRTPSACWSFPLRHRPPPRSGRHTLHRVPPSSLCAQLRHTGVVFVAAGVVVVVVVVVVWTSDDDAKPGHPESKVWLVNTKRKRK